MQQAQETTTKAEAKSNGTLRLVNKRGVVELQFRQVGFQMFVIGRVDRVNAAEHHRVNLPKTGQCR